MAQVQDVDGSNSFNESWIVRDGGWRSDLQLAPQSVPDCGRLYIIPSSRVVATPPASMLRIHLTSLSRQRIASSSITGARFYSEDVADGEHQSIMHLIPKFNAVYFYSDVVRTRLVSEVKAAMKVCPICLIPCRVLIIEL